jgi:hypothetical protein
VKTLGMLTAGLLTGLAIAAAVLTLRSLPDLQRYMKIRSM